MRAVTHPPTRVAASSVVARLLAENRHYDAQYGGGASNHLSMTLLALRALGASDTRLAAYAARYRTKLEGVPAPASEPIARASWRDHLGTHARYADYVAFFRGELAEREAPGLVTEYLAPLLPGVSAAAFHPLIRLSYAVEAGDAEDIAVSLAYLADAYLVLGEVAAPTSSDGGPIELLHRLAATSTLANRSFSEGLIFDRFVAISRLPDFSRVVGEVLPATDASLTGIAACAATLYASTRDFTALHTVTATHAMRILAPLLGDSDVECAARHLLQAVGAAYVSIGTPSLLSREEVESLTHGASPSIASWDAIAAAAVASDDEHVIKFVYTCREEDAAYGRPLYRLLAAKKARLA